MQWYFDDDHTRPVFTAEQHAGSAHNRNSGQPLHLPPRAVAFCLGRGLPVLQERFAPRLIIQELPAFISHSPVYDVPGHEQTCFLDGGRGAPQAACAAENLHALGVREVLIVGLCGAFGEDLNVCDLLIPERLLSEEGASRHYAAQVDWVAPSPIWPREELADFLRSRSFTVKPGNAVTTDAVYRQTFYKEALWRSQGCVGVDMEASAIVSVCNYYGMRSQVVFMASDKHPLSAESPPWDWGSLDFRGRRDDMIEACIEMALR